MVVRGEQGAYCTAHLSTRLSFAHDYLWREHADERLGCDQIPYRNGTMGLQRGEEPQGVDLRQGYLPGAVRREIPRGGLYPG